MEKTTVEDSYESVVVDEFDNEDDQNKRYEYYTEVGHLNTDACDESYAARSALREVYKDTNKRNDIMKQILCKRDLTSAEQTEYDELRKRYAQNKMTPPEYGRMMELHKLVFENASEKQFYTTVLGADKCFYYKNAHKNLLPGKTFKEYDNMTISRSKEPANIIQKSKLYAEVQVHLDTDPISKAIWRQARGHNTVLLNCGNHLSPGGFWKRGGDGMEESLYYRSSMSCCIDQDIIDGFYPLMDESVLYCDKVLIYRDGRSSDYSRLSQKNAKTISVITATGSGLHKDDEKTNRLSPTLVKIIQDKFRNILATAAFWGKTTIIMTALGSYRYKHHPTSVARIFRDVFFDDRYSFYKRFEHVDFCIPQNTPQEYYQNSDIQYSYSKTLDRIKKSDIK